MTKRKPARSQLVLRILGAHNLESRTTRFEAHLIDGILALDAGGLTRTLTFEEQDQIRAVLLSHRHFDHVRDLLPLGLARCDRGRAIDVYGIKDTLEFVSTRLLDGSLYPDLRKIPTTRNPALRLHIIDYHKPIRVAGYSVTAIPVPHTVPAAGYVIASGNTTLFFTGDAGRGLQRAWEYVSPTVLLSEVTYGNRNMKQAILHGHMTPSLLARALRDLWRKRGYRPRVIVAHMSPPWESSIRKELKEVEASLGIAIEVAEADTTIKLK